MRSTSNMFISLSMCEHLHALINSNADFSLQMHFQSQNYVEAALTLKLHSDLHEWDLNSFLPPMEDLGLPQQSQFHRKETLCLLILDYLGKQILNSFSGSDVSNPFVSQEKGKLGRVLLTFAKNWPISTLRSRSISMILYRTASAAQR
jgi:hypothetical protein